MNKTGIVAVVIIVVLLGVGALVYSSNSSSIETTTNTTNSTSQNETGTGQTGTTVNVGGTVQVGSEKTFTAAQIATHKDRTSCYSSINGNVYDLTKWIDSHPGGPDRILSICGKDGSSAFTGQHAGEPKPEQILAGFKVGVLVK